MCTKIFYSYTGYKCPERGRLTLSRDNRHFVTSVFLVVLIAPLILASGIAQLSESLSSEQVLSALAPPSTAWSKTYGGSGNHYGYSVVQTKEGGYVVAGHHIPISGLANAVIVKTFPNGTMQWNQTYGGADIDIAKSIVQTTDGGYAIAGYTRSSGAGMLDMRLIKTDKNGTLQWDRTFGGAYDDMANAVVQTSDGGYAIAGYTKPSLTAYEDFMLVKTSANGSLEWSRTYGYGNREYAYSMIQTRDGGYAVAGNMNFGGGDAHYLVKTDTNGNLAWNQTYGIGISSASFSVIQTTDGGYALAGLTRNYAPGGTQDDFQLVKIYPNGTRQWWKNYGRAKTESAKSVVQTLDGGYALAGYTDSWGSYSFWLVKADKDGNHRWNQTYSAGTTGAWSLIQTFDGGYAMAGQTSFGAPVYYDFLLIKLGNAGPDTDGDYLYDNWEISGIDYDFDGTVDLTLTGANWMDKDFYIEIDYMGNSGTHDHNPDAGAIADVVNAFANAPVTNPDAVDGITMHIQVDEAIPHQNVISIWDDYNTIKKDRFGTSAQRSDPNKDNILAAKKLAYRYSLFIHQYAWGGAATTSSGIAELPGNDFVVSLGAFTNSRGTRDEQAGTLMHEFGHTLKLRHGGGDNTNGKPNYLSIMSYTRQFSDWVPGRALDYSRSQLGALDESNLNENSGINGPAGQQTVYGVRDPATGNMRVNVAAAQGSIDWNLNGNATEASVAQSVNYYWEHVGGDWTGFGDNAQTTLQGYNDWDNLEYNFRYTKEFADGFHLQAAENEITSEIAQEMKSTPVNGVDDVAIRTMASKRVTVGTGYCANITVTVENQGNYTETFQVTLYADTNLTIIGDEVNVGNQIVTGLVNGTSTILPFVWNTTGITYGNYTISAYAAPVLGETDKADNVLTQGFIAVTIPGDINGDKIVNVFDLNTYAKAYSLPPSDPKWLAEADINNDSAIDSEDLGIINAHYGQSW
jgi:hypothetical protein